MKKNYFLWSYPSLLRGLFNKPISHVIVWKGIEQAKLLNCKTFEFGRQDYDTANREKESKISDLKRGIGGYTLSQTVISK